MSKDHAKNNYRDSLFRKYFEHPDKLAALHELLTGIPTAEQNVEIKTLKSVLFNRLKNDISFKVGDRFIVLFEHQSTINPNMPARMLLYSAMLYRKMLSKESIYSKKLIPLSLLQNFMCFITAKNRGQTTANFIYHQPLPKTSITWNSLSLFAISAIIKTTNYCKSTNHCMITAFLFMTSKSALTVATA